MKKKFVYIFAALAIVATVAFNVNLDIKDNALAGIALENVEALASGEDGSVTCCEDKYDTCVVGNTHVSRYDEC